MTSSAIIILAIAAQFFGAYALYSTSRKATLGKDTMSLWFQKRRRRSTTVGLFLLIFSFVLLVIQHGVGAGIFEGFILLMTTISLIVILAPLGMKES